MICTFFVPPYAPRKRWRSAPPCAKCSWAASHLCRVPNTRYNLCWLSRLRLRPVAKVFPTHWALGILISSKPTAALAATGVQRALFNGLGKLISAVPHCAPPTTLRIYYQTTRPICPICGALLKATEMGPQRSHVRPTCAAQAQVLSLSWKRCRSASRARPQPMVRSPNDRRLHLSPHHRPSVTMAAVGRMAASTRVPRRRFWVQLAGISPGQLQP